jgi:NTE family protein
MSNSVRNKVKSCDLFIEPPNMSRFSLFDVKKSNEIFEYGYNYTLTLEKEINNLFEEKT